jgi:hypothetical protein
MEKNNFIGDPVVTNARGGKQSAIPYDPAEIPVLAAGFIQREVVALRGSLISYCQKRQAEGNKLLPTNLCLSAVTKAYWNPRGGNCDLDYKADLAIMAYAALAAVELEKVGPMSWQSGATLGTFDRIKNEELMDRLLTLPTLPRALAAVGRVMTEGAKKYGSCNWHKISAESNLAHAVVHAMNFQAEYFYEELTHCAARCMMALDQYLREGWKTENDKDIKAPPLQGFEGCVKGVPIGPNGRPCYN